MSRFGSRVRQLRIDRGWTAAEVGIRLGMHRGYVTGIETGRFRPPSVRFARKYARIFGADEREFVLLSIIDKVPEAISEEVNSAYCARFGSPFVEVPLINQEGESYPDRLDASGLPLARGDERVKFPAGPGWICAAMTVSDDAMAENAFTAGEVLPLRRLESITGEVNALVYFLRAKVVHVRFCRLIPGHRMAKLSRCGDDREIRKADLLSVFEAVGRLSFNVQP